MRYKIVVNCEKVRRKKEEGRGRTYLEVLSCIFLQVDGNVRDKVFLVRAMTVYARMKHRSTLLMCGFLFHIDPHVLNFGTTYIGMGGQAHGLASFIFGKNSFSGRGPEPVWTLREKKTDVIF